jgi:hypothetical protein
MSSDRPAHRESPDSEITPEMIRAGEAALRENYQSLCAADGYPEIARTVFLAMEAVRFQPDPREDRSRAPNVRQCTRVL